MIDPISKYQNELKTKFKGQKTIYLNELIKPGKRGEIIEKGTLVVMPFANGTIQLKILDKNVPDKGFSIPLRLNDIAEKNEITNYYLLWYLKHKIVIEYLINYVTGSVLPRIPKKDLFRIKIPIPKKKNEYDKNNVEIIRLENNKFREMIGEYYNDYTLIYKYNRFKTAIILAGTITEIILYKLLLENGVDKNILKDDNTLTLGKIIIYIKILKLDKSINLPMNHIINLQKKRNNAIHINLSLNKEYEYKIEDLHCFEEIIKYFGI